MINQELTYWTALMLLSGIPTQRKNAVYVECYKREPRISIIQLFEDESVWPALGLTDKEMNLFAEAKAQLANTAFMVEELLSQGYHILPLDSPEYPKSLKHNLKLSAPTVIFVKGDVGLLQKPATAVVGSRNADSVSLTFTDNVVRNETAKGQVVVSGFAKGVDRQALDATLLNNGESIIVLPQGITTFTSGYKQLYKQIMQGHVTVISTFHPKAPWRVELAMARNAIIYGLADTIYAAQSDSKGGTWAGVTDGLRRQRKVYVRHPESGEKNANLQLIALGAQAVDINGTPIAAKTQQPQSQAIQLSIF
jgi:predicted Rossmann fold nucleotide-binding protein DprA/Smf involved in DNA uptake